MNKLETFLAKYPPDVWEGFAPPTCGAFERGFKRLFAGSTYIPENGMFQIRGIKVGQFVRGTEVFHLDKWVGEEAPQGPFTVMIYNPNHIIMKEFKEVQVRNGLALVGDNLFAGAFYNGFRVRRPVKPHYQESLKNRFKEALSQTSQEFLPNIPLDFRD